MSRATRKLQAAPEPAPDRLLNQDELAELLGLTKRWVQIHTQNGDLPHFRLGRYPRYRLDRVQEWLAKQERGGRRVA